MSEQTQVYFYGENDWVKVNVAVGKRENPYILDGKHNATVGFSLITVEVADEHVDEGLEITLCINGIDSKVLLELNPLNMTYMADIGYALNENDKISVTIKNYSVALENISKNFSIDYRSAIKIGFAQIKNVKLFYENNHLKCEGYLKLLDGNKFGGEGLYWHFTLLNAKGDSESVLISVIDENDVFAG